ncbi:UNVERIFIED_CONTAM: hypothetical protein HDU68_007614 [Siphonaria sp. JEL0065]|nr:hypothetical protein HDU68_007614 [Siphonaria sp. JEL0065]
MSVNFQQLVYPTNNVCDTSALRFGSVAVKANATACATATTGQTTCSTDASAWYLYDSSLVSSCVDSANSPDAAFKALNKQYARISYFSDKACDTNTFTFYTVMNECYYVRPDLSGLFSLDANNTLHWDFYTGGACTGDVLQNFQAFSTSSKCDSSDPTLANFLDPTGSYTYNVQILGPKTTKPKPNKIDNPEYNKVYTKEVYTAINALVLQDPTDAKLNKWLFDVVGKCNAGLTFPVDPACFCKYGADWTDAVSACAVVDAVYKNNNTDCNAIAASYKVCESYVPETPVATTAAEYKAPAASGLYSGASVVAAFGAVAAAVVALLI